MDRSEMEKLFYEGAVPQVMFCPEKKEYKNTLELMNVLEGEFRANLTPEQLSMLDDYKSYRLTLNTLENEEHFIQGLSLGIRMTGEAYTKRTYKFDD